ncbi:hypothetical protein [Frondihabitans sp. PAMC 28766]|uniref:hypothetical protein n=1 Tax=Frondihabitans sp. PAMC 28766 TaxID=1795630 RepID=UPI0012FF6440|nr:hypothetical protein [Frondihabitans sp. PAMC 28766]
MATIGALAVMTSAALTGCSSSVDVAGAQEAGQTRSAVAVSAQNTGQSTSLTEDQQKALAPLHVAEASFAQNRDLSSREIVDRFHDLDDSYEVLEAFDPADAEFVRIYAHGNAAQLGRASRNFNNAKTSGGMTGRIQGNLNTNGSGPITHKYSVSVKMASSAKVSKTNIRAEIRSYGVVGSSGIGLTYSATPSVSTTAHSYNFNRTGTYTSVAVYDTIIAFADFHGGSYSFNVQS